jgi:hypothetical protein
MSTESITRSLVESMFNTGEVGFVLTMIKKVNPSVDSLARFFTLSSAKTYSGQNAWLFNYKLRDSLINKNEGNMQVLLEYAFDLFPTRTNPLLTVSEANELERVLYMEYGNILSMYTCSDVNDLCDDLFGDMFLTQRDLSLSILTECTTVAIDLYKITKVADEYVHTVVSSESVRYCELIPMMESQTFLPDAPDIVMTALWIKFAKEMKCYRNFLDLIK